MLRPRKTFYNGLKDKAPDILEYTEYRKFLADRYRFLKSKDKRFSHRHVAQKAGAQSSGWFADVMAGRQKLKHRLVDSLAATIKLDSKERDFLRLLVEMENADSPGQTAAAYEKWFELKGVKQETVNRDRFKYFEHWYYPALRELLSLKKAGEEPDALATKLIPPISPKEARDAIQTLTRLGVLMPGNQGPAPVLVKDSSVKSKHWKTLMTSYQTLAGAALNNFGKEERDFSALTLSLSNEGLKKAGEEITALRKRLLVLSERDKGRNKVYQGLFQLFPVSNTVEVDNV